MSVTFTVEGERADWETWENLINLANGNAYDLLVWLGLDLIVIDWSYGSIESSELAARCRRRLWTENRNHDPGKDGYEDGRVITCGRRAGYLPEKAAELLKLCERANGRRIVWG